MTVTEQWNGTAWTEVNDLSTQRYSPANGTLGTSGSALATLGAPTPSVAGATEEWAAAATIETVAFD